MSKSTPLIQRPSLASCRRVAVKAGTAILTNGTGRLDPAMLAKLAADFAWLYRTDRTGLLISSGAVGAGMGALGLTQRPQSIQDLQAAAAVGQSRLMAAYEEAFRLHGLSVAQVLLTAQDLGSRTRYLNLRNTLDTLERFGVVPILNENDSVSVDELRFGDNDLLAAQVSALARADILIIFTDIPGLYNGNPKLDPTAKRLSIVERVTKDIRDLVREEKGGLGRGGMLSKLLAAEMVTRAGHTMVIAQGKEVSLERLLAGEDLGTLFLPRQAAKMPGRDRWIAFSAQTRGTLVVDDGAAKALVEGKKSLLPAGIREVRGSFPRGAAVLITALDGKLLARGLANYSAEEFEKIRGVKGREIAAALGYTYGDEAVHRNHLALVE